MEQYLPVVAAVFVCLACVGLFLSGVAAMRQAGLGKKLFKLRCEQMRREQQE